MSLLKSFFVSLGLDLQGEQFAKGQLAVSILEKSAGALVEKFQQIVAIIPHMVDELTDQASELQKAQAKTGVATDALQELAYAANQTADVGLPGLTAGLQALARKMADAEKGSGGAADAFRKMGIKIKGEDGKLRALDDVLSDIADSMSKMPNEAERLALAMKVMRGAGVSLIPMLKEGSAGIEKYREEARDLGLVMSESLIEDASANEEAQKRLKGAWQGVKNIFGGPFLQMSAERANRMAHFIVQNKELLHTIANHGFKAFFNVLEAGMRVMRFLVLVAKDLARGVLSLGNVLTVAASAIGTLTLAMAIFGKESVLAALKSAAAWAWAALPWLALTAILVGLILIIEDIWTTMNGGDGVINDLLEGWQEFVMKMTEPDPKGWWVTEAIKAALRELYKLKYTWTDFRSTFTFDDTNKAAHRMTADELRKRGILPEAVEYDKQRLGEHGEQVTGINMFELQKYIEEHPNKRIYFSQSEIAAAKSSSSIPEDISARGGVQVNIPGMIVNIEGGNDPEGVKSHVIDTMQEWWTGIVKQTQVETSR